MIKSNDDNDINSIKGNSYVIISYSTKDIITANIVYNYLKANNIKCWMAPQDITPGATYADEIDNAIKNAFFFVLIFSENSQKSEWVNREVERAVSNKLKIIPFKIKNIEPSGGMALFIAGLHSLNAFTVPIEKHLIELKNVINNTGNLPKPNNKSIRKLIFSLFFLLIFIIVLYYINCNNKNIDSTSSIKEVKLISEIAGPVAYSILPTQDGQYSFVGWISDSLEVKLIPSFQERTRLKISKIDSIVGVNHFLLDHDLTTGFVHSYTQNFYNRLRKDDFVLKLNRSEKEKNRGFISYIKKSDVKSKDKLGQNLAFFRQWKLSEIVFSGDSIKVAKCKYAENCVCPQVIKKQKKQLSLEIPLWCSSFKRTGLFSLKDFPYFDKNNGGTVVIIWENPSTKRILFCDVHGSLQTIMNTANVISKKYKVDPTIAISNSGVYSRKFRSENNNILSASQLNNPNLGAGFGYIPIRSTIFEITYSNNKVKKDTVPNNCSHYKELMEIFNKQKKLSSAI